METTIPSVPPLPPVPSPAPMRRSMRWLMIASLTINFLVLGAIVGAAFKFRDGGPPHMMELTLGPFARALDQGDRRAILRDLMQDESIRPPRRNERDAAAAALVVALRAEPFTLDQVRTMMDQQKDWVMATQTAAQEAVLARISAMTAEERGAFADRLEGEIGRGGDNDQTP